MGAAFRHLQAGGGTSGTGNRTVTVTVGIATDLLVVFVNASDNTNASPTVTDNHADGLGTYTLIATAAWNTSGNTGSAFVRNALLGSTDTSFVVTADTGSNTAAQIAVMMVSGMTLTGISAIRGAGLESDVSSGATPAPVLSQESLTTNMTIAAVFSADTSTTPPTGWTERTETQQTAPTTALEVCTRNSGFVGQTITFGATCNTEFASMAIELDGPVDVIIPRNTIVQTAVHRSFSW